MELSYSIAGIVNEQYPTQGLGDIKAAGIHNIMIDMSMYCTGYILRQHEKELKADEIREDFSKLYPNIVNRNLKVTTIMAPYLCRDTKRTDLNELLLKVGKDAIRYCEEIGCHYIIIHPLYIGIKPNEEWEVNKKYYLELAQSCNNKDTMILLQNQCKNFEGHLIRGVCSDAQEVLKWINELNQIVGSQRFGFCLDVGVCNICGQNMQDFIVALNSHIKAVLLTDNNGYNENFMMPFVNISDWISTTDWLGLIRGLRQIGYNEKIIVDFHSTIGGFPPILRSQVLALSKSVAEYFKWQIELETSLKKYHSIVLFGAGNMCRNFMKCYGEQYKPLFTCDNNSSIWGTQFCGLEVKNPEELKNLPEDCGVYICNMYYREIKQQLKDLGVKNIEFFNDEYLSSYYEDRLKRR